VKTKPREMLLGLVATLALIAGVVTLGLVIGLDAENTEILVGAALAGSCVWITRARRR
jgi:hypothetical protein